MAQMSLGGLNAVKMLKGEVETRPFEILIGAIGDLNKKFDIPVDAFKLNLEQQACLLFDLKLGRPILVHQKTALAALYSLIHQWNVDEKISEVEDYKFNDEVIGQLMKFEVKNNQPIIPNLIFLREEGKFGKWNLKTD